MVEQVQIIVISLADSGLRRAKAAAQLNATGLAWHFQDAIKGADLPSLPKEYDSAKRRRLRGYDLNPGEIGCFLSHRQAWQACLKSQRLTLVLEDDFRFEQEFARTLAMMLDSLPDFDVLKLHGLDDTRKCHVLRDYGTIRLVSYYRDPLGTTAYLVKPEAAKRLLDETRRFHDAVDGFLASYWQHSQKVLALAPFPVALTGVPSTIQCFGKGKPQFTRSGKLWSKILMLPRSTRKRIYWLKFFITSCFKRVKHVRLEQDHLAR